MQTSKIHTVVSAPGEVTNTLAALKASPAATKAKAKLILATDGSDVEAEDLTNGDTVACAYRGFPDHFGFFRAYGIHSNKLSCKDVANCTEAKFQQSR